MTLPSGLELPMERIAELCREYHVKELSVFGSAARGDFRPDSDVDLLVEFEPGARIGLIAHSALQRKLSEILERPVDLVSKRALRPHIRPVVMGDTRLVYAA